MDPRIVKKDEAGTTGLVLLSSPLAVGSWEFEVHNDRGEYVLLELREKGGRKVSVWVTPDDARGVADLVKSVVPNKSLTERFAKIDKRAGNRLSRLEETADR